MCHMSYKQDDVPYKALWWPINWPLLCSPDKYFNFIVMPLKYGTTVITIYIFYYTIRYRAYMMHEINGACELDHDCIIWCIVTHWLQTGGVSIYLTVENKIMTSLEEWLGTKSLRLNCWKLSTILYRKNQNLLVFFCLSVFTACSITPGFWNGMA